ncbi:cyclin-dependent kinase A-1-like [Prosopis cineraria]|nr:cyclin-dependent kinase A-1-like [Prosopis cineraria]
MCEFVQTIISFCESVVMCCSEWGMWNPWIGSVPNLEELNYNVIGPVTDCTLNKVYRCVKADVDQSMVFIKEIFMPDGYNTAVQTSISAKTSFFRFHGHPNIIRELRSFRRGNYMYIVYEYFSVDLSNFISFPKIQRDPQTRLILQQILSAVKHCHSYDIILGDIKPKYIQINFTARLIKLADFGFAGAYGDPWASYPIKPSQYSAPELLFRTRQHSKAADMWSVGCIFGELVIGKPVFQGTTTREQLVSIFR